MSGSFEILAVGDFKFPPSGCGKQENEMRSPRVMSSDEGWCLDCDVHSLNRT